MKKRIMAAVLSLMLVFVMMFGMMIEAFAAPEKSGDANNDGKINADDAIYMLYFIIFGSKDYPMDKNGDYNNDGKVNKDDAVYLLYHTIYKDIYPDKYKLYPQKTNTGGGDNWSPDII